MPGSKEYSSFSAFASVDALASKPILGSDGAASWQEFRNQASSNSSSSTTTTPGARGIDKRTMRSKGTAPHMPIKQMDKAGTGFRSIAEERAHEEKMRNETNSAKMNSGYTTFKRKEDRAEAMERKRRKLVEQRIRPDDVKYFIKAETFSGWKEDYVFTTKESRGVGYYWDGMDSLKKLQGIESYVGTSTSTSTNVGASASSEADTNTNTNASTTEIDGDKAKKQKKEKKKKKKRKKDGTATSSSSIEVDTNNPMEQVLNAMRRRNDLHSQRQSQSNSNQLAMETKAALTGTMSLTTLQTNNNNVQSSTQAAAPAISENESAELAKFDWEAAIDPSSGKTYFFSRKSGERQWDNPIAKLKRAKGSDEDKVTLPDGWRPALDAVGRTYYYHRESGKTSWEKPLE